MAHREVWLIDLGIEPYEPAWLRQRELVDRRWRDEVPDILLFVEHPHVVTRGRKQPSQTPAIPRAQVSIPIYEVERGGEATYHGPGQLVGYPILKLDGPARDLHLYLRSLERVLVDTAGDFGLSADTREGATGVWLNQPLPKKIASIGIAVKHWVTYHGFALNVSTDLSYFERISPCGFDGSVMTSMEKELGVSLPLTEVKLCLVRHFERQFEARLIPKPLNALVTVQNQ